MDNQKRIKQEFIDKFDGKLASFIRIENKIGVEEFYCEEYVGITGVLLLYACRRCGSVCRQFWPKGFPPSFASFDVLCQWHPECTDVEGEFEASTDSGLIYVKK